MVNKHMVYFAIVCFEQGRRPVGSLNTVLLRIIFVSLETAYLQ